MRNVALCKAGYFSEASATRGTIYGGSSTWRAVQLAARSARGDQEPDEQPRSAVAPIVFRAGATVAVCHPEPAGVVRRNQSVSATAICTQVTLVASRLALETDCMELVFVNSPSSATNNVVLASCRAATSSCGSFRLRPVLPAPSHHMLRVSWVRSWLASTVLQSSLPEQRWMLTVKARSS
jgi:hypothetical protein